MSYSTCYRGPVSISAFVCRSLRLHGPQSADGTSPVGDNRRNSSRVRATHFKPKKQLIMSRKTAAVIAQKSTWGHWKVIEIDDIGNERTIVDVGMSQPTVSCTGSSAYIAYNGSKYLYDFSNGYGTGYLKGI
jgi:hypothetical protein